MTPSNCNQFGSSYGIYAEHVFQSNELSILESIDGQPILLNTYTFPFDIVYSFQFSNWELSNGNWLIMGTNKLNANEFQSFLLTLDSAGNVLNEEYLDVVLFESPPFIIKVSEDLDLILTRYVQGGSTYLRAYSFAGEVIWDQEIHTNDRNGFVTVQDDFIYIPIYLTVFPYPCRNLVKDLHTGETIYYASSADLYESDFFVELRTTYFSNAIAYGDQQFCWKILYNNNGEYYLALSDSPWSDIEFSNTFVGKVNSNDELLWLQSYEGDLELSAITDDDNLIFVRSIEEGIQIIKMNGDGEFIECEEEPTECNLSISGDSGQLTINGIIGENSNVNVFNENFEVIWSCSWWSDECNSTEIIDNLAPGNYAVAVQSSLCDFYEMINVPASRSEERTNRNFQNKDDFSKLNIFPNPVQEQLNIQLTNEKEESIQIEILDSQGRLVFTQKSNLNADNNHWKISTSALNSGLYYLNVIKENGMRKSHKFVKR